MRTDPGLALQAAADRRVLDPQILDALQASPVALRLEATRALMRLRDPAALPPLRHALRDPDPRARIAAAFGLSILPTTESGGVEAALVGAAAASLTAPPTPERDQELAVLLRALGRIGAGASLPALRAALDRVTPSEGTPDGPPGAAPSPADGCRLAATDALTSLGRRQVPVTDDFHGALARLVATDPQLAIRIGAARALSALPPPIPPEVRDRVRTALLATLHEAPADLAAMILAALAEYPPPLADEAATLARSEHPGLALEAFRTLARVAGPTGDGALASALTALSERAFDAAAAGEARTTALRLLGDVLPVAFPRAREPKTYRAAQAIYTRLNAVSEPTRAHALAHCAAAELVDRGREWPAKTPACGLGAAPAHLGPRRTAAILADVRGEDALRATYLGRLFRSNADPVKAAALEAMAAIPMPAALPFLLQGLGDSDVAVVHAALRLLVAHRQALLAEQRGPSLHRPLATALETLTEAEDLQGLIAFVDAARAIGDPRDAPTLRALAAHSNPAVREAALAALGPDAPPPDAPPLPANPIGVDELASRPSALRYRVRTARGVFVIALAPELSPVTTRRFQNLVDQRFYDGLTFHARSPGFVLQGGDPRGDGYGGPGYSLRDEPAPSRFERGTVGLALAGPDTGGSQFFITLSDQPALEGRYTPFGRVVEGMDVVDAILPGDRIERIEPVPGDPAARPR